MLEKYNLQLDLMLLQIVCRVEYLSVHQRITKIIQQFPRNAVTRNCELTTHRKYENVNTVKCKIKVTHVPKTKRHALSYIFRGKCENYTKNIRK